jgi:hypothetical protein
VSSRCPHQGAPAVAEEDAALVAAPSAACESRASAAVGKAPHASGKREGLTSRSPGAAQPGEPAQAGWGRQARCPCRGRDAGTVTAGAR